MPLPSGRLELPADSSFCMTNRQGLQPSLSGTPGDFQPLTFRRQLLWKGSRLENITARTETVPVSMDDVAFDEFIRPGMSVPRPFTARTAQWQDHRRAKDSQRSSHTGAVRPPTSARASGVFTARKSSVSLPVQLLERVPPKLSQPVLRVALPQLQLHQLQRNFGFPSKPRLVAVLGVPAPTAQRAHTFHAGSLAH